MSTFNVDPITLQIDITRRNYGVLRIEFTDKDSGDPYVFQVGDVIRFKVFNPKNFNEVVLSKDILVNAEAVSLPLELTMEDTEIGEITNKHTDYYYEVELNPDTRCQTIIGCTVNGKKVEGKIFRLLPEGGDKA